MAAETFVKPLRALTWPDAASADWALVQQCAAGDEDACTRLVTDHQRMVYQLALHLLGDPQEALDLSQEVFLRVFRTLAQFRGQSTLRTWIYRIVVNQASNRQRWWRRRRRAQQVALDEHTATHGELAEVAVVRACRIACCSSAKPAARVWARARQAAVRSARGHRAAGDRRAELRRDRHVARRRRRHRQVPAGAGAREPAAGPEARMKSRTVPESRHLGAFVDGELSGADRLRVSSASGRVQQLRRRSGSARRARRVLRTGAGTSDPEPGAFDGLAGGVISRVARRARSVVARLPRSRGGGLALGDRRRRRGRGHVHLDRCSSRSMLEFGPAPERDDSLSALITNLNSPAGTLFVEATPVSGKDRSSMLMQVGNDRCDESRRRRQRARRAARRERTGVRRRAVRGDDARRPAARAPVDDRAAAPLHRGAARRDRPPAARGQTAFSSAGSLNVHSAVARDQHGRHRQGHREPSVVTVALCDDDVLQHIGRADHDSRRVSLVRRAESRSARRANPRARRPGRSSCHGAAADRVLDLLNRRCGRRARARRAAVVGALAQRSPS